MSNYGLSNSRFREAADQEETLRLLAELVERASIHPFVVNTARIIVQDCGVTGGARSAADDLCELKAIYRAVKTGDPRVQPLKNGFKYIADPRYADYFSSPVDTLQNCLKGACAGDCLPGETLLLTAGFKFKSISQIQVGDVVMGDGDWVRVTAAWNKGRQEILEFVLNNSCVLRCTPDHKVFVVPKIRGYAGDRREAIEVRASEVRPGDDLLQPERLPFGRESIDPDRAWLLGLHVAEGWVEHSQAGEKHPLRVGISGLDGHQKEANKHRAQAFLEKAGVATRWHEKYLSINDSEIATWLAACGHTAINKHLPSLNWDEATLREIKTGLDADADLRNGVFSTISPELALQYRIVLRMLGQSAHLARVDDHGGFGKHPIYRVTPRAADDNRRRFARVRTIGEGDPTETFDIEVEGHRFYLPETDLIVHNCDDHAALLAALAGAIGFRCALRAWGPKNERGYSHVYAMAGFPKRAPKKWVPMDTTVASAQLGWEPPRGNVLSAIFE